MLRIGIALVAFLFISSTAILVAAQEKGSSQQTTAQTPATKSEDPKNEVDQMLEDAAKRGEKIMGTCVKDCGEDASSEGVETGRMLHMPKPAYPPLARLAHVSGEVKVQVIIDVDGKVIAAAAIEGHPLLFGATVAAAREAVFSPTRHEGKPVKVVGVISYNFVAK